jgi:transcription-repair coupling factor (superfamily II helicase)
MEDRLTEYRRLASAESPAQLRAQLDALEERTGELPTEVLNLGWLLETRLRCRDLGIARLSWLKVRAELQLDASTSLVPAKLTALVARLPNRLSQPEPGRLQVRFSDEEAEYPFRFLHWLLELLREEAT